MPENRIEAEIARLKAEHNAVILAHNYQIPEVQDIGDFVGDSLELSRKAAETEADVIVFCGVHFMAETAAILSPNKTVLLPDPRAGCPMADMITVDGLLEMKAAHPGAPVVTYVNSSAAVKAESDVCCTSANAVEVCRRVEGDELIFVPDRWLGSWVARQLGKTFHLATGYCPTHVWITAEDVLAARAAHPGAAVFAHPECRSEVVDLADEVLSTSGMIRAAGRCAADTIIICTEQGILHRMRRDNPGKTFVSPTPRAVCPNMKLTTLEKVLWALEDLQPRIIVEPEIADRARRAIERMIEVVA
jgi:quinolinate synthase